MKPIQANLQTLCADLLQQLQLSSGQPASVKSQSVKGRRYLKANVTIGIERRTVYIGPADSPAAQKRAAMMSDEMARAKARRQIVSLLRRAGLPGPNPELGRILEVIALAGLFRNGAVLVGTAAYQCYSPLVGVILPSASMMTQDADIATASLALSAEWSAIFPSEGEENIDRRGERSGKSFEDLLRLADPTFSGLPTLIPSAFPSRFRSRSGFVVDLLVPVRSREDRNPKPIPALRAGGTPLQHLDWLIREPSPAVCLFGSGVLVHVPQPARYAVHKLVVAQKREPGSPKRSKDLEQAKLVMEAMRLNDTYALDDALEDAMGQGRRGWRERIRRSLVEIETQMQAGRGKDGAKG